MNKRNGFRAKLRGKRIALAVSAAFIPLGKSYALPTGEAVVAGTVTVARPTAQTMQIDQATPKGIVNWQGFSIGATEHVNITQPSSTASLLNRVVGNDPSQIFGRLTANGQVFLVNNAGVFFAPGASVEVGSLLASTLSITDQNFLNGVYQFTNPGNAGAVTNAGSIITPGGFTALIGPQVTNSGVIIANAGKVALGAGDRVSLDMIGDGLVSISVDQAALNAAIVNAGTLQADGGTILLKASSANALLDTVINTSGLVRAHALVERNGEIVLEGTGNVQVAGQVLADGGNIGISASGALNVGSTVCCFPTSVVSTSQSVSAASITVGGGAQVIASAGAGSQTITTPGTLLVRGGVQSTGVGIFHNGSGEQRITAGEIQVRGGTGNGTSASIASQGPGNQIIDTSRIEITGGSVGTFNPAMIRTDVADQTVNVSGDIIIAGDVRGEALLQGSAAGMQTIHANNISITSGLGGTDSFGVIRGGHQEIHASGNVVLTGGATGGTVGGVRIGGLSGAATDLDLFIGGDLRLTGGSALNNTANIGSSGAAAVTNNILIDAGGSVVLNQGAGSGSRIGSGSALAGGNIQVNADGAIALNGVTQPTAIRTLGSVTLQAASISEAGNGFILANTLGTTTTGNTTLTGPNQVSNFSGSAGGSLSFTNNGALAVTGLVNSGSVMEMNVAGNLSLNGSGLQDAMLRSSGGQTVTAHSISLTAQDGRRANIENTGGNQSVTASGELSLRVPSAFGVAQIVNTAPGGNQTVTATLPLSVLGGVISPTGSRNSGIFKNGAGGLQSVTAPGITLQGASSGTSAGAQIVSQADQFVNALGGDINLFGGNGGVTNNAILSANSLGQQTVLARDINVSNGTGGTDTVAGIFGGHQMINATGNVTLTSQAALLGGAAGGPGVRIGSPGGSTIGTDLNLQVGGNLMLSGGAAENGGGIGSSSVGTPQQNTIQIQAGGSVILTAGSAPNSGVRIGSGSSGTAGGNIFIDANGAIGLNGTARSAAIRTLGNVTLDAASISEAGNGFILANTLGATTTGNTSLTGPNQIANFSGSAGGDLTLNNTGALNVSSLFANNATLTNAGNMTLSGPWNTFGATSIAVASDLTVNSFVQSNGPMMLDVDGAVRVVGSGVQDASLTAFGGQTINARSLEITSLDGRLASVGNNVSGDQAISVSGGGIDIDSVSGNGFAFITNSGTGAQTISASGGPGIHVRNTSGSGSGQINNFGAGDQTITVSSGGGVDVRTLSGTGFSLISNAGGGNQTIAVNGGTGVDVVSGGGFATISQNAPGMAQTLAAVNADHINVNGVGGTANIAANGGPQTISITGIGANAIAVGSAAAIGSSQLANASTQSVTAGLTGEQGSITIVGPAVNGVVTSIVNRPGAGGTQTIATSGLLSITGGTAPNQPGNLATGIFHNGTGQQTITADALSIIGGSTGNNNTAIINVPGGGVPANQGAQSINVSGDIHIAGGAGGNAGISGPVTRQQTIFADNIHLTNSALGGNNSVGFILAGHQEIHAAGDVTLTARASGGDLPGVRIGSGTGANSAPSDVRMFIGGDLTLTGGTVVNNGVGIGSTAAGAPLANEIFIQAGGSVILNSGVGAGARIGSSATTGTAPGNISIIAGGGIELNGTVQGTAIRTLDNVALSAASISEASNGFIVANSLTTTTTGNTSLTGPNQVSNFSGSAGGDLTLNNTGALNVSSLSAASAALTNSGNVTLSGPWNTFGATSISIASDLTVTNNVQSFGPMTLDVDGAVRVVGSGVQDASLASFGGQTINARALEVTSLDGRFVSVRNTGPSAQTINLSNGAGLDVQTLSPGGFAQVSADAGGSQTINVVDGDHVNVNGVGGAAMIGAFGGAQTISITGSGANAITLGAPGSLGPSSVFGGVQSVTAGTGSESGSITIVGGNANATFTGISSGQIIGGTQTVSTSGTLRIAGGNAPNQPPSGFATGLFHNGSGEQRVNAANLEMQGGSSGVNNTAIIISSGGALTITPGDQVINVAGNVGLAGGAGGTNNTAIVVSFADQTANAGSVGLEGGTGGVNNGAFINIANPGGNQLFNIAGDISIAGGAGGSAGFTGSPSFQQTIFANDITLTNAAAGGNNSVGFILGGHQAINATGDVTLEARASGGTLPGVRIGGLAGAAPTATDLQMFIGGDLVLTGGTVANNGVGIGSTAAAGPALANTIHIQAGGSVILNSGVGAGARIGSSATTGTGPGNISINAGGGIELNGTVHATAVRTLDNVTLSAASISEASNGLIVANSLTTSTSGNTTLIGPNQLANFSGSAGGDLTLNNTGALNVSSLFANNATLTNSGNVTLSGPWNTFGSTSISIASDLTVSSFVQSNGPMTVNVDGAVRVVGSGVQDASLTSFGGQSITAQSLEVTSLDGRFASVGNNGTGDQTITVSGGAGVDVQTLSGGGFSTIGQNALGFSQTIAATNADHVSLNGLGGGAIIFASGAAQTVSITGSGANAITLGSAGALGFSQIANSSAQTITAGLPGEQGSITIVGPAANSTAASIVSRPVAGGTQTIATSGALSITGGTAPNQTFGSGVFHNGSGAQTITAADISITGGPSGSGNRAQIASFGGGVPANAGHQILNVAGGEIRLRGSDAGIMNTASIFSNADQTINGDPDLVLVSGASAVPGLPNVNLAVINTAIGRSQTIHAGTITMTNSATANTDSFAGINATQQQITTTGDVYLTANGGSARIGGQGAGPTNLQLAVGGNLLLDGGTLPTNGVGIGSTGLGTAFANNINIVAAGDVVLNSGASGARIGSAAATGTAGGNISISANSIQLKGTSAPAAIRTLDNVTLQASSISETGNGLVLANGLSTNTSGNTSLVGPNQVANFNGSSGADLTLSNNGALNVGNVTVGGAASISAGSIATGPGGSIQASTLVTNSTGATSLTGPNQVVVYNGTAGTDLTFNNAAALNVDGVQAGGTATLAAGGAMTISGPVNASGVVLSANGVIDEIGGGAIVAGSLMTVSTGDTALNGANQVAVFNATSTGGDVSLNNTGVLDVTGMNAFGDATISNIGNVTVSGPWTAGGTSTITVGSDILLRSAMQSHDVILVSTTGDILQETGASIVAETLSANSFGDTHLDGTNVVGTISVSSTEGDVSFSTSSPLLTLSSISLPGALLVNHTGAVTVQGQVSALSHDISATGNVTVGGANAQGATLLHAPGHIFLSTPETILVRGSDTAPGALASVLAGGGLRFDAGEVTIRGGGALLTPAIVRGASVDMSVGRLNVTGGSGHLSPAWLLSGSDINLTVGEAVRLQTGSGLLSWAKVQTETRDGVIRMTFPTLPEGGFYVNGDEGDIEHGQTGFYTLHKPVKIGDTLILEYGAP